MQESFDFDAQRPPRRPREEPITLGVAALNAHVREMLESRVPPLWVEGEISGWKRHSSGHRYFCLRDADAQINAVLFRSDAQRLPAEPEEGMHVRVFGSVTLYDRRGDYQLVARRVEATGDGGLWKLAFEKLRAKLEREGLLDPARKRALPLHPRTVGIVTSPVGAALHDILHVIERRAPWTRVVLSPARVQGEGAAFEVARAIQLFERGGIPIDVLIVGRGGGSIEDLWAFNEEPVARAIAACPVPVISAVGHEVDVTIADLVADLRAPTPSAAAEHAVPDGSALRDELAAARVRLARTLGRFAVRRREQLNVARERLDRRMHRMVEKRHEQVGAARERIDRRVHRIVERRRATLMQLAATLDALSPLQSLARGYAVPLDEQGRILRRTAEFNVDTPFRLRVADGTVRARTENIEEEPS
ncbi:MAG TPA: exodeoxyribonuclease VII large subunit [Longimicrobiales bacterium]|nr:exodeoxyribonuclease VII large subunit [Longimicrobiales bacterium]